MEAAISIVDCNLKIYNIYVEILISVPYKKN